MTTHIDAVSGKPHITSGADGHRTTLRPLAGKGQDGSNVLPTDTAIANAVTNGASATTTALKAAYVQPRGQAAGVAAAPLPFINARDYNAKGDGTTDDTAAIQAAVTAAGVGGRTVLPPGVYKCTGNITTPLFSTLEGSTTEFGSGAPAVTELSFTTISGSTTAVTMGVNSSMKNLIVRGPGYSVGTCVGIAGAAVRTERVTVASFATGVVLTSGFYASLWQTEFRHNGTGLKLVGCYNVNLYSPQFNCTNGATWGTAIDAGTVRPLNIFGGTIESFTTGITCGSATQINLFGTYWETDVAASANGIVATSLSQVTIAARGCMVYLNGINRWIDTASSTSTSLTASGNHFTAITGSTTAPLAYRVTPGQAVDLSGDNWSQVAKAGSAYAGVSTGSILGNGLRIAWPPNTLSSAGSTTAQVVTDGRVRLTLDTRQTLASAGAVTIDASTSDTQTVVLQANATSTTITNPSDGQTLAVTFEQDATGGRTYAYPAACRFAGGAAPSSTTLSTRTTVTFIYRALTAKWYEMSRSVAVPI